VQRLFDRDASDPKLYHLLMDSTAISLDVCSAVICQAALDFWRGSANDSPPA